jgi:hypothetical protein
MSKTIKAVGVPVGTWFPVNGKAPDKWTRTEIPKSPGEYQLVCTDDSGKPVQFPLRTDFTWDKDVQETMQHQCEPLRGVIYCGMTTCLYCRFWQLVKSWTNSLPKKVHDSRETWDQRPDFQQLYKPANMLCRFRRISVTNWHKKRSKAVHEILKACWPDIGTNHTHPSAAAAIIAETFSLLKWEKCFGRPYPNNLPPLNKGQAERLGDEVTGEWLGSHFGADCGCDEI